MESVISIADLSLHFGEITAVDELTLDVYAGEIFGLLGHNGAGKTTTVRLINGMLAPASGSICVLGYSPISEGNVLRRHTGVLTETPSIDERLTGRENLTLFAALFGVPRNAIEHRVEELLLLFEMMDRADDLASTYSRGMKQRLALARAMLHKPEILFLDEPSAGLDPVVTRRLHQLIQDLSHRERHTVFLCTHNLLEAQKLCDRVALLEHGQLIALGTPADLARQLGERLHLEIEIQPASSSVALDILQTVLDTPGITSENGRIVIMGIDREMIPEIITALTAAQIRIYRASTNEPTLEDVYYALHDEKEAQA